VELGSRTTRFIGTGGYAANGNATHDADIRVGQDGALIEYSSSSSSYVSGGGAGGTLNRGVCQCYEQFRRNEVGSGAVGARTALLERWADKTREAAVAVAGRVRTKPI
jgi:hypothetical protein